MIETKDFINNTKFLYNEFMDDKSKKLFMKRLEYSITNDKTTVTDIWSLSSANVQKMIENIKQNYKKEIFSNEEFHTKQLVLYGAGYFGQLFCATFPDETKNAIFCDRNENFQSIMGRKVITPKELVDNFSDSNVIITAVHFTNQISDFLHENNINILHVLKNNFYNYDTDEQYFDDVIKFSDNEVFVDAGVFDADTSIKFAKRCPNYKSIHLFEPDEKNFKIANSNLEKENLKSYKVYDLGLGASKSSCQFLANLNGASHIISEDSYTKGGEGTESITIEIDKLDDILKDEKVTFIKMDIEGAEMDALIGATNIIKTHKPKLAISVYHKPEDIIDIPLFIKNLVPEYKFYLRHYATSMGDTVLYAVL